MNVDQIVQDFAEKLAEVLTRQMRKALASAGGIPNMTKGAELTSSKRAKGQKRTGAELEQLKAKLVRTIESSPGKRTEYINAALGTTTAEVAGPLRQLVADMVIKTTGERHGTKYLVRYRREQDPSASERVHLAPTVQGVHHTDRRYTSSNGLTVHERWQNALRLIADLLIEHRQRAGDPTGGDDSRPRP